MNTSGRFNWTGWWVFAGLLLLWEVGSRSNPKLALYIPPLSHVLASLGEVMLSGQIMVHLFATLSRFLRGYLLAAAIAVTLGVCLGYFRMAHSLLAMMIELLRPMPSVAIIPVAILLLGIGDAMIVAVTVSRNFSEIQ